MIHLKLVTLNDINFFYDLKCEHNNMYWTGSSEKPVRSNIEKFIRRCIAEEKNLEYKKIYIIYLDQRKIGYQYFDFINGKCFSSIGISEEFGGRGYGSQTTKKALEIASDMGYQEVYEDIMTDNIASIVRAQKAGGEIIKDYVTRKYVESRAAEVEFCCAKYNTPLKKRQDD